MEHLNKQQIILLALLVCFVTSIATGITVVSLLGQTSQPVVQTINRVVEKTIQQVVPQAVTNATASQEKTTVVVKEEDLTISAIDKNSKSLVRIGGTVGTDNNAFLSDGVVVSGKGYIIADKNSLPVGVALTATFGDGTKTPIDILTSNDSLGITLLLAKPGADQKLTFSPVGWADSSSLKLGQTVISLANDIKNTVNIGNISSFDRKDDKTVSAINTNSEITNSVPGSMLFNLSGDVSGINIGTNKQSFIASNILKDAVTALLPK